MISESDCRVYEIALPGTVKAFVHMGEDSFYSIYVNSLLSPEERKKAIRHELRHIARDDFSNGKTIREAESD